MKVPASLDRAPADFDHIFVNGSNGPVPLDQVASYTRSIAPCRSPNSTACPTIRSGSMWANTQHSAPPSDRSRPRSPPCRSPATVKIRFGGNAKYFLKSIRKAPLLLAASLIEIYIVSGILYESLSQPITILSTLPSAGVGALLITGTSRPSSR